MNDVLNPANYPTYQIGDQVTIRQWDDMAAEFGFNQYGEIKIPKNFTDGMKSLCGQTFTINDVRRLSSPKKFDSYYLAGVSCVFSSPMFEQSVSRVPVSTLTFDDLLQGGTP